MSDALKLIFERAEARCRDFEPGQHLFHRGDEVRSLFMIVSGVAGLLRRQESGTDLVLQRAADGRILAEASVYSSTYHCDGVAHTHLVALAAGKRAFLSALRADPELAEHWSAYLARQVQQARFRSEVLALRSVSERLDTWLDWHDGRMPPRGQWQGLASEIGVTREALYRELSRRRC